MKNNFDLKKYLVENRLTRLSEQDDEWTVKAPKEWGMKSLQKGDFIYPDMYNREILNDEEAFWMKLTPVIKPDQKLKQFDPDAKKTNWAYTGNYEQDFNLKDTIFKITSIGPEKVKFMEFDMNMNPTHNEYVAYIKDINDYLRPPYEISPL